MLENPYPSQRHAVDFCFSTRCGRLNGYFTIVYLNQSMLLTDAVERERKVTCHGEHIFSKLHFSVPQISKSSDDVYTFKYPLRFGASSLQLAARPLIVVPPLEPGLFFKIDF